MPRPNYKTNMNDTLGRHPTAEKSSSPAAIERLIKESPRAAPWNGVKSFRLPTLAHPAISSVNAAPSTDKSISEVANQGSATM